MRDVRSGGIVRRSGWSAAGPGRGTWAVGLALVAGAMAAGCGDGGGASPAGGSTAAALEAMPVAAGRVDLSIGETEGGGPAVFGRVAGVAEDSAGRIFVVDGQAAEVRAFGPDGRFLFRFGREGAGPGEARQPCCPGWGPDGRLWIRDTGNARFVAFRVGADSAQEGGIQRMPTGAPNLWAPTTFDAEGRLVSVGMLQPPPGQPPTSMPMGRAHVTASGDVAGMDTIPEPPPEEVGGFTVTSSDRGIRYAWQPYGPRHVVAHGPEGEWAETTTSRYRVELHDSAGQVHVIDLGAVAGPELTAADRAGADSSMAQQASFVGVSVGKLPFSVPDRKTPLRYLFFGDDGLLWVERNVTTGDARRADVFGPDGAPVARRAWPHDVSLLFTSAVDTTRALGIRTDSLGVERVVRVVWR